MTNLIAGKTYRLTQDVTNPKPDRRQRHDWRASVTIKAGTEFQVRDSIDRRSCLEIYTGRWSHHVVFVREGDALAELIVPHLELVDTSESFLDEMQGRFGINSYQILTRMLEAGTVTRDQIEAFARVIDAEEQAEFEAAKVARS